jgi:hypothetical protein
VRRLATIVAILALVMASDPALAESLVTTPQQCYCNMPLCPMHHPASSNSKTQTTNCGTDGRPYSNHCSMSACYSMQFHVISWTALMLVAPLAIPAGELMQPAPVLASLVFTSAFRAPASPPPRPAFA